jgi:U5 snRNP spliceosome subunit
MPPPPGQVPPTRPSPAQQPYPTQPTYQQQPPPPPYAPPGYQQPHAPPPYQEPAGFGSPTYHHTPAASRPEPGANSAGGSALLIGRSAISGTNRAARAVTRKVIRASKADGADESGLTALIWNQVLSYGADAMIVVALASTVFFGASTHAQRGNVLLYLLITMAPFAVVAPVIGPALDRLQHGRRWTMAATGIGRAILALVMAAHSTELLILYPCALGSLVLSKAYAVVRASAAPRLVPRGLTLTEANARLSIFGLGSTLILGGFVGVIIKVTGSYSFGLIVTAAGFAACAAFAFKLPKQIDSAAPAARHPQEAPRPRSQEHVPPLHRLQSWARRGFEPHLVIALQGQSALRLLVGMLTIYLALFVEATHRGFQAVLELGLVIGAAGVGNFLGNAIGTRLKLSRPELVIVASVLTSGVICLIVTISFSPVFAAAAFLIASTGNSLSKIALDSLIQRDVTETLRSSAFGRSETFLQLAWVVGAAIGVGLPSSNDGDGAIGFLVAGVIVTAVGVIVLLRNRATSRASSASEWPGQPGSVSVD